MLKFEFQNENVQRKTHQKMTDLYLPYREENFWINLLFLESTMLNLWNKCWSIMSNWFKSHAKFWWSRFFSLLYLLQLGKQAFIEVLGRVGREWMMEWEKPATGLKYYAGVDWAVTQRLKESHLERRIGSVCCQTKPHKHTVQTPSNTSTEGQRWASSASSSIMGS